MPKTITKKSTCFPNFFPGTKTTNTFEFRKLFGSVSLSIFPFTSDRKSIDELFSTDC